MISSDFSFPYIISMANVKAEVNSVHFKQSCSYKVRGHWENAGQIISSTEWNPCMCKPVGRKYHDIYVSEILRTDRGKSIELMHMY